MTPFRGSPLLFHPADFVPVVLPRDCVAVSLTTWGGEHGGHASAVSRDQAETRQPVPSRPRAARPAPCDHPAPTALLRAEVRPGERPSGSLPGMRERTVSVSSAGKTISFTGWKVGWVTAPPRLAAAVQTGKQYLTLARAPAGTPSPKRSAYLTSTSPISSTPRSSVATGSTGACGRRDRRRPLRLPSFPERGWAQSARTRGGS
jgi:hypothetical protein